MFLTAQGKTIDLVLELKIGADDYVVTPFKPRELAARLRRAPRRAHLFDRAVGSQVSRLCHQIEVDSRNPELIQIAWDGEYMLAADVKRPTT